MRKKRFYPFLTDPVTLACYAKDNDLLEKPGWKHQGEKYVWMVHQARAALVHNIMLRLISVVLKHDLRQNTRHVMAGGQLTDPSKEDVYSGVVSLRSIRSCMQLA